MNEIAAMKQMFEAAIDAAQPAQFMPSALPYLKSEFEKLERDRSARLVVVGFGKASAAMAAAFEQIVPPTLYDRIEGCVVVPDGHDVPTAKVEICLASHPVPDSRSQHAAATLLALAQSLGENDVMVVLISGGGSALCCMPQSMLSLAEKQQITGDLLRAGANISQMNILRKHLSQFKGGRLAAAAYPAKTISFGISDVPGDDISVIASGPTIGDPSSCADALDLISTFQLQVPDSVISALKADEVESVFNTDKRLSKAEYHLLATPQKSLEAAAHIARKYGYSPVILGDALEGESRLLAKQIAQIAATSPQKTALISGGETTVTVVGDGVGGRNVEFVHALSMGFDGFALAADTDGIDGGAQVAGAYITPDTKARAHHIGLDSEKMLHNNDSHSFFRALGDQVITGPTLTNVNDFRVVLV